MKYPNIPNKHNIFMIGSRVGSGLKQRHAGPKKLNSNVFKPDPDTEPDDLPDYWVTGSTAGEPRVNK